MPSDEVRLAISQAEARKLLALLTHTDGLVRMVNAGRTQNFLGNLIKKVAKAVGKSPNRRGH